MHLIAESIFPDTTKVNPQTPPFPLCMLTFDLKLNHMAEPQITDNTGDVYRSWSDLPSHLLALIINKLINNIIDYIRFGAVCRSWQSVYTTQIDLPTYSSPPQRPLLMLTTDLDLYQQTRSFYCISKSRLSNFRAPMPPNNTCRGSTHGWLVMVDKTSFDVHLFNPFLSHDNKIKLPSLNSIEELSDNVWTVSSDSYLVKAVLSVNPTLNSNYVVMAIYGPNRLAFFKLGDERWTSVEDNESSFADILYYRDQFYAVSRMGAVFSCDMNGNGCRLSRLAAAIHGYETAKIYLAEASGELLQVKRTLERDASAYSTTGFEVFKLDTFGHMWIRVKNLIGQALFLGNNSSICVPASDFIGCEANSIYFTDDSYDWSDSSSSLNRFYDSGVFNMKDASIERHYGMKAKTKFPPPIWVEPTPRRHLV